MCVCVPNAQMCIHESSEQTLVNFWRVDVSRGGRGGLAVHLPLCLFAMHVET